jgi:hypothetical protein
MKKYKFKFIVTSFSAWKRPENFTCNNLAEAKELQKELKDQQYLTEVKRFRFKV